jgi:invasion protein IalB
MAQGRTMRVIRSALPAFALLLALPAVAQQQRAPAQPPAAPAAPAPAAAPPPASTPPATTQPAALQTEREPWTVACDEAAGGRRCQLSANVVLRPQNQRLLRLVLTRQPETRSLGFVFQVPHGVLLPAGVSWQMDEGEAQRLAFQTSDADGVYAGVPVTDDLLAALRRARVLRLSFVVAARRETLTMPVPMAQFSEGVTQFFAAEQQPAAPRPADPAAIPAPPPPAPAPAPPSAAPPRR